MGNHSSTPSTSDDDRAAIAQHEKNQRLTALWTDGILVPPMFGIPTDTSSTTTSSSTRMIPSILLNTMASTTGVSSLLYTPPPTTTTPILLGYVDYLRTQSDISYRLLHTHLQSGLWITSFTSKNAVRVGIFDTNNNNTTNHHLPYYHDVVTPLKRSSTSSSSSSSSSDGNETDTEASVLRLQQSNRNNTRMMDGQVTLERQFIDDEGRNYGSIQCHTDPTNPLLPYTIQLTHRPIPSVSLFGVYTSSSSIPSTKQTASSSSFETTSPSTNGYIGAQFSHTIPISSNASANYQSNNVHRYDDTIGNIYNNTTTGVAYVARTNPCDDDSVMHCNMGIYVPIHWDNVINTLDSIWFEKSPTQRPRKDTHLIPFSYDPNKDNNTSSNHPLRRSEPSQSPLSQILSSTKEVNGCASVSLLGATAAIQGTMPLSIIDGSDGTSTGHNNKYFKTSSYFSTCINDDETNLSPIQLTIQQQNQFGHTTTTSNSSISVSQIITFQRYHFNIVDEYRAPYVHNTLAWTIQMESLSSSSTSESESSFTNFPSAEDSGEHKTNHFNHTNPDTLINRMNRVSLGLAWQMNRNVALKAVLYPQSSTNFSNENSQLLVQSSSNGITATTAILFKRWYYPRITCSILHKWKLDSTKNWIYPISQFAGIGIDIETGDNNHYNSSSHRNTKRSVQSSSLNDDDINEDIGSSKLQPPTITVLPKELYKLKQAH